VEEKVEERQNEEKFHDLAHDHALQRRPLEPSQTPPTDAAHSISSPVSSTNTSSRFVVRRSPSKPAAPLLPSSATDVPVRRVCQPRERACASTFGQPRRRAVDLGRLSAGVVANELSWSADRHNLPVRDDRDGIAQPLGLLDVVRAHQNRDAFGAQQVDQRPQLLADLRIQADGGLVEQQQPRLVQQRAGDQEPAAHPAAQVIDDRIGAVEQVDDPQDALDRRAALGRWDSVEVREHAQVLRGGQRHVEVVQLRDDAHLRPRLLGVLRQLVAEDLEPALVGDHLCGQRLHRGGLAGAVGAEEADAGAVGHLQVKAVDRGDRPEALDHAPEPDRRG